MFEAGEGFHKCTRSVEDPSRNPLIGCNKRAKLPDEAKVGGTIRCPCTMPWCRCGVHEVNPHRRL